MKMWQVLSEEIRARKERPNALWFLTRVQGTQDSLPIKAGVALEEKDFYTQRQFSLADYVQMPRQVWDRDLRSEKCKVEFAYWFSTQQYQSQVLTEIEYKNFDLRIECPVSELELLQGTAGILTLTEELTWSLEQLSRRDLVALAKSAFGMWKDRKDTKDSVEYVRKLRSSWSESENR